METGTCPPPITSTANDAIIVAVNWLSRLYVRLDEFCRQSNSPPQLPISHFIQSVCLQNTQKFKAWFVDLWNTKLVR